MKTTKILRMILNIIGYAVVGISTVFLISVMISHINGNMTFIGRHALVWIMTDSMEETIPAKSYILIEKVSAADVKKDDIIIYRSDDPEIEGMFNTHRVIDIVGNNEEFVMKGDHNQAADKYNAAADKVVGRYIKGLPRLSLVGRFLATKMGVITSVTTIFALFVAICFPGIISAVNERIEKQKKQKQEMIDRMVMEEVERLRSENSQKGNDRDSNG